jgi:hypothetical protein
VLAISTTEVEGVFGLAVDVDVDVDVDAGGAIKDVVVKGEIVGASDGAKLSFKSVG